MIELIKFSFSLTNIIPTILLLLVLIYWITVFLGFLDLSSLDFDFDTDVDMDVDVDVNAGIDIDTDVDVDADVDTDVHIHGPNFFIKSLLFFNIGKVPFMAFLSILTLPLWVITILANYYLDVNNFFISLLLFFPALLVSMFLAKLITHPIAKMFQKIDNATGLPEVFQGKIATVRITVEQDSDGQIELIRDGATAYLTARSTQGKLEAGQEVLIIDYIKEKKYYLVEPYNL